VILDSPPRWAERPGRIKNGHKYGKGRALVFFIALKIIKVSATSGDEKKSTAE
jgi:hypothetical protein